MPLPQPSQPEPSVPKPGKRPEIVPPPERPRRSRKWLTIAALLAAIGAGLLWQLMPETGFGGGGGGGGIAAVRSAPAVEGQVERTIRLTGSTKAERFVRIISPRMRGSRSRRGANAGGSVGVKSNISVNSTSSVAPVSTMSSLSQTGMVATSSGAATRGGGAGGGSGGPSSAALQASTSRSSGGGGSSTGNINAPAVAGVNAMGASGLGSTANSLSGGSSGPPAIGGGGGRRRGDFHLALQKLAPAGTRVKAGDVIAEFDRQYMETRLDDYYASVSQQDSNLQKSKADIEVARDTHTQTVESAKSGLEKAKIDMQATPVLSAIQAERTRLALEEAKAEYERRLTEISFQRASEAAELREQELQLQEAQVELKRAENNVDKLLVKAPIDGMVVLLDVFRSGQMAQVKEGDELYSGQPFLQVVDTSSMVVEAKVNQVDAEKLRIGQKARVYFDAFPELELPARVYSIGTVANARQYRREFVSEVPVRLKLTKTTSKVIPDLSVAVDVILQQEDDGLVVPVDSVFTDGDGGSPYVYVKNGQNWERRNVELGLRNNISVTIRSGVAKGEEVALERPPEKIENN